MFKVRPNPRGILKGEGGAGAALFFVIFHTRSLDIQLNWLWAHRTAHSVIWTFCARVCGCRIFGAGASYRPTLA